uniref:Uncharacterized protein n=1 Tax=Alexandrium catenella TaxID=2925 RepID=A0A7S1R9J1_ALECA
MGGAASVALYATPSYSSLYVEPEDLEPGPGAYDVSGTFGQQQLSTKHSYPSSSLTAKHDRAWAKTMITKDHLSVLIARGTPGPGSYDPEASQTQARVRFGTARRRGLSDTRFRAPGPVYEVTGDPDSPPAQVKFGKASRFDRDCESLSKALGSTGPGQYETPTIFDGANLAKSFGASHRAYDRVRFPGSERMEIGRASPGPGAARAFENSGKGSSFGRAERLPGSGAAKRAPGPGAYENHERPSPFSRSQSVYSFGRPHPRGRINWRQMQHLSNSVFGIN